MSTIQSQAGLGAIAAERTETTPSTASRRRLRFRWRRLVSPLVLIGIWQLTNALRIISPNKLPPPSLVVSTAYQLIAGDYQQAYGTLQGAMGVSLERFALGFGLGAAAAILLAIPAGVNRIGEAAIDPIVQMMRTLPLFGLIPVFIVWFGIGQLPKILLIALGASIPLYLNMYSGIRSVDGRLHELGQVLGLSRRERLLHIVLPGALPQTLVGLRQSLGVAWLALVVAEQFNASAGLGFLINQATQFNDNDVIFVALAVYTVLGLLTDWIVRLLERRTLRYRPDLAGTL